MQTVRSTWTDERLDDLTHKVDEMNREMHAEFRAMHRTMLGGFLTLFAAIVATLF